MKKPIIIIIVVLTLLLLAGFIPHQHIVNTTGAIIKEDGFMKNEYASNVDITVQIKHSLFFLKNPHGKVSINIPDQNDVLEYSILGSKIYSSDEYHMVQIHRMKEFGIHEFGSIWFDKNAENIVIITYDTIISAANDTFLDYVITHTHFGPR